MFYQQFHSSKMKLKLQLLTWSLCRKTEQIYLINEGLTRCKYTSLPILFQIHILYIYSSFNIFIVTFWSLTKKNTSVVNKLSIKTNTLTLSSWAGSYPNCICNMFFQDLVDIPTENVTFWWIINLPFVKIWTC